MTQPHPQRELLWEPYWITPPELYKKLDDEFHFDYDPCPFPKPENYDGLKAEWGKSNYVNPPFHRENGVGPTAFVRKAIEENKKGKTVVLTIPTQSYVNLLLEAGAEVRSLGRVRWLHTVTREPMKGPSPITAFILRSRPHAPAAQAPDTLGELKITQEMLYEFCEWFCDHNVDCSEAPCNISVSRLHERLEGIMKQMKDHPEYLAKWDVKRAEQESLRGGVP